MGEIIDKFHNLPINVLKSIVDQIKLLSWVVGAVNGYFVHLFGNIGGVILIVLWWSSFQFVAHYILYSLASIKDNKEETSA
ncbi:MAG: hypothetical protein ACK5WP_09525 [Neisseriaceae bacterium]|jgi:hypothetical protein